MKKKLFYTTFYLLPRPHHSSFYPTHNDRPTQQTKQTPKGLPRLKSYVPKRLYLNSQHIRIATQSERNGIFTWLVLAHINLWATLVVD